ncbi:MAG: nucleotidyltransferase domain-containing protein [Nanoarchaeota archaeon]|nr:nucleotidyltransferase domain-containing protein [Nanoarchaeota archaeon]MBU1102974.1 nucleotidyltransferase domain-containing protein [Nanoarchaeota archaeon]
MLSNEKVMLLEVWRKNLFRELSIAEIMKESGKKTKTWVFNALKLLVSNNVLNSTRKANLDIYRFNLENPLSLQLLQYLEAQSNLSFSQLNIISEIIEKIPVKNCSIIVFGSYAENKQTKNSDLDLCILIENKEVEKKIKPYINEIKLNHPIKIDEHYVTSEDFVKMLLHEEENLAKQIFIKHRLFYNSDTYYQLLKEAYKHGFRS